ncbi:MAG: 4Fe-4S binding protein, partial [Halobacteria archaeon]|nr:4Fe-4S binding protein [Halobacteria archaeon]
MATPGAARKTDEQVEQSLYAKAEKIYPREVHGLYARLRVLGVLCLLGLYYILPWIRWEGHQALLFDLPARKFHIFFITLWPQDFIYLAALLIIAGLTLFFVTALWGRIWCGYACPQTVWTEAFLWIERKIEGTRMQQQKLDAQPMNARKFRIKATKQFRW